MTRTRNTLSVRLRRSSRLSASQTVTMNLELDRMVTDGDVPVVCEF